MKKQIATLFAIVCLFGGTKAFSQVIVSGGNLKEPVTYQTIDKMKKARKKLSKVAKAGEIEIKIPVDSSFRNTGDITAIFTEVFNSFNWNPQPQSPDNYFKAYSASEVYVNLDDTIGLANLQKNEICFYVTSDSNTYTLKNVSGLSSTKDFADSLIRAKAEKIKCTENQFGILFDSRQQTAEEAGTVNAVWNGQGNFKDFLEDIKNTLTLFSSAKISSILVSHKIQRVAII